MNEDLKDIRKSIVCIICALIASLLTIAFIIYGLCAITPSSMADNMCGQMANFKFIIIMLSFVLCSVVCAVGVAVYLLWLRITDYSKEYCRRVIEEYKQSQSSTYDEQITIGGFMPADAEYYEECRNDKKK